MSAVARIGYDYDWFSKINIDCWIIAFFSPVRRTAMVIRSPPGSHQHNCHDNHQLNLTLYCSPCWTQSVFRLRFRSQFNLNYQNQPYHLLYSYDMIYFCQYIRELFCIKSMYPFLHQAQSDLMTWHVYPSLCDVLNGGLFSKLNRFMVFWAMLNLYYNNQHMHLEHRCVKICAWFSQPLKFRLLQTRMLIINLIIWELESTYSSTETWIINIKAVFLTITTVLCPRSVNKAPLTTIKLYKKCRL